MGRIVTKDEMIELRKLARKEGKLVVFTNGVFDLVHLGHVKYLKGAKSLGDYLYIGLNSDASVKKIKGEKRPIQPQEDRAEIVASFYFVDFVCLFDEETPQQLILQLTPDILVKGSDYTVEEIVGADHVIKSGGRVETIQIIEGRSTREIIRQIVKLYGPSD